MPGKFKCEKCDYTANRMYHIRAHNDFHHEGITQDCNICDQQFATKSSLMSHHKRVHENLRYQCDLCDTLVSSIPQTGKTWRSYLPVWTLWQNLQGKGSSFTTQEIYRRWTCVPMWILQINSSNKMRIKTACQSSTWTKWISMLILWFHCKREIKISFTPKVWTWRN